MINGNRGTLKNPTESLNSVPSTRWKVPKVRGIFDEEPTDRYISIKPPVRIVLKGEAHPLAKQLKDVLGQCEQTSTGNCYQVAFLNSLTTHPLKARKLLQAVKQVDDTHFEATLRAKWDASETVVIPVERAAMFKAMHLHGTRGPLFARVFEYARALHEMQRVPLKHIKSVINNMRDEKASRYKTPKEALEASGSGFRALTGKSLKTHLFKDINVANKLDELAPKMDQITLTSNANAESIQTVEGKTYKLHTPHAYSVLDIDAKKKTVTFLNPHINSVPQTVTYEAFAKGFCLFDIGYF